MNLRSKSNQTFYLSAARLFCAVVVSAVSFIAFQAGPSRAGIPSEFDRHYAVGKDFLSRQEYKLAVDELSTALKIKKTSEALVDRATAFNELKRYDAALADLDSALALNPHSAPCLDIKGVIYLRINKPDLAIAALDKALAIDPQDRYALVNRAGAYLLSKDPAQATKTVALLDQQGWKNEFSGHAAVLSILGLKAAGKDDQAKALAETALKKLNRLHWPYAVIKYFVGKEAREQAIEEAAESTYNLTQAQAFIGLDAYFAHEYEESRKRLSFVTTHGVVNSVEYWLAKHYMTRLNAASGRATTK